MWILIDSWALGMSSPQPLRSSTKESYNAIEKYELNDDGTIQTTFTFLKGGFDGPLKTYRPKGFVKPDGSNAVWGMQFVWPIKADYQIVYLDESYTRVIVARRSGISYGSWRVSPLSPILSIARLSIVSLRWVTTRKPSPYAATLGLITRLRAE